LFEGDDGCSVVPIDESVSLAEDSRSEIFSNIDVLIDFSVPISLGEVASFLSLFEVVTVFSRVLCLSWIALGETVDLRILSEGLDFDDLDDKEAKSQDLGTDDYESLN
jgi:hypothetical protein